MLLVFFCLFFTICVVAFQTLSRVRLFVTPCTAARQACLSFTISLSLLRLMSIEPVMPSNQLILCRPLLLLLSIFPSIRAFSKESALHFRWQSIGDSASASVFPMNIRGLLTFKIDLFDLLLVKGTLKSLLQYHSLKASILRSALWSNSHIHT